MKILHLFFISLAFLLIAVKPVEAKSFTFSDISQSISKQLQRVYLKLPGDKPGELVLHQSAQVMAEATSWQMTTSINGVLMDESGEEITGGTLSILTPVVIKDDRDEVFFKITEVPQLPFFETNNLSDVWLKTSVSKESGSPENLVGASGMVIQKSQIGRAQRENRDGVAMFVIDVSVSDEAVADVFSQVASPTMLAALDPLSVRFWVEQKSMNLVEAEMPFRMNVAALMGQPDSMSVTKTMQLLQVNGEPTEFKGVLNVRFSDYNQPNNLVVPTDAIDIEEAIMKAMVLGISSEASVASELDTNLLINIKPVELQELSRTEKEMLKRYGVDIETIIE